MMNRLFLSAAAAMTALCLSAGSTEPESAVAGDTEAARLGIDREPVFRVNLPYQPADGSKPELNPTPFCWLPATGWSPDKIS